MPAPVHDRGHLLPALVLMIAAFLASSPASAVTLPRGIYVYSEHLGSDSLEFAHALILPGVDGITLLQNWTELEPSLGKYHWVGMDNWISQAIAAGKQVVLAIRAGGSTPCWLFGPDVCGVGSGNTYAGATPLDFLVSPRQGIAQSTCDSVTIAAPWDPVFLAQWDSLLTNVAAHLKKKNEYDAVVGLRLTGINRNTAELRLPEEILSTPCAANSIRTWLAAGYRPDSLKGAWNRITDMFGATFPDKSFGLEVVPDNTGNGSYPFPEIDSLGCVYTSVITDSTDFTACRHDGPMPDDLWPLVQLAAQKFTGRLTLSFQNLDINSTPPNAWVVSAGQQLGLAIGFQTNDYDSLRRAGCSSSFVNPAPCDSMTYFQMLNTGVYPLGKSNALRSNYLEVLAPDALAFPWSIQQAHQELTGSATTAAPGPPEPLLLDLRPNAPNPFARTTTIRWSLLARAHVTLAVYNLLGGRVATPVDAEQSAGEHAFVFDAVRLPAGVYFYTLHAGFMVMRRKLAVVR